MVPWYRPEGKLYTLEDPPSSSTSNEVQQELNTPDLIRGIRNPDNLEVLNRLLLIIYILTQIKGTVSLYLLVQDFYLYLYNQVRKDR